MILMTMCLIAVIMMAVITKEMTTMMKLEKVGLRYECFQKIVYNSTKNDT